MKTSAPEMTTINKIAARHGEWPVDFFLEEETENEGNEELGENLRLSRATILLLESNKIKTIETLEMQTRLSLIKIANMKEIYINEIVEALGDIWSSLKKEFPNDSIPDDCTLNYILWSGHWKTQKKLKDLWITTRWQLKNSWEIPWIPGLSSIIALIEKRRHL